MLKLDQETLRGFGTEAATAIQQRMESSFGFSKMYIDAFLIELVPEENREELVNRLKRYHDAAYMLGAELALLNVLRTIAKIAKTKDEIAHPDNPLEGGVAQGATTEAQ